MDEGSEGGLGGAAHAEEGDAAKVEDVVGGGEVGSEPDVVGEVAVCECVDVLADDVGEAVLAEDLRCAAQCGQVVLDRVL